MELEFDVQWSFFVSVLDVCLNKDRWKWDGKEDTLFEQIEEGVSSKNNFFGPLYLTCA